jgi:hypothetical protein
MLLGLAALSEGIEESEGIEGSEDADGMDGADSEGMDMDGACTEGIEGADMLPKGLENWALAGCASARAVRPVKAMRVAIFMRLLQF